MTIYGYARVSTTEQNEGRQIEAFQREGVEVTIIEKASGKNVEDRPQLKILLDYKLNSGDVLIVESISRIARNTKDLLAIVETLKDKNVTFKSLKENIDTATPQGQFMLTVFGAMAQLERDQILQRQKEGIALAKAKGVYKGRKPIEKPANFDECIKHWKDGLITATKAIELTGMKRTTFYKLYNELYGEKTNK